MPTPTPRFWLRFTTGTYCEVHLIASGIYTAAYGQAEEEQLRCMSGGTAWLCQSTAYSMYHHANDGTQTA